MRVAIQTQCTECKSKNYSTSKNKEKNSGRIEMKKYCKKCRKHTMHKEIK